MRRSPTLAGPAATASRYVPSGRGPNNDGPTDSSGRPDMGTGSPSSIFIRTSCLPVEGRGSLARPASTPYQPEDRYTTR